MEHGLGLDDGGEGSIKGRTDAASIVADTVVVEKILVNG